jgi:predicted small secreted protein
VVLGALAVVGALVLINALASSTTAACPNTGDPTGKPIADPAERALILGTFSEKTVDRCWPGTRRG